MNKYFEMRTKNDVLFGIIENIPENVSDQKIKERIEVETDNISIEISEKKISSFDIIFDWEKIDKTDLKIY